MKNSKVLLLLIFLFAFLIRIVFMYAAPIKIWDETVYLNLGQDLSHNLLNYSFTNGWSDYIPTSQGAYGYPNAGFRAPLLPYILAFLNVFNLTSLINFLMPLVGALSVVLVYLLGKELFDKKVGIIAALLFALIPLHVSSSARVLTDALLTFFVLLSFLSYWKGFEKGSNTWKILFGVFMGLSLLSRYTALWILPIFFIYAVTKGRLLELVRDKYLWYAITSFLIILLPLFIYGSLTYQNPIGPFIHGTIASKYWGGIQAWYYFFGNWWQMFSSVGFIMVFAILYLGAKNALFKKEVYILLIWFFFFLGIAMYLPHKEDRFILPLAPTLALIAGYSIAHMKHHKGIVITVSLAALFFSNGINLYAAYDETNHNVNSVCYQQIGNKLKELQGDFLIVSENSSLLRYYTHQESTFYPSTIDEKSIKEMAESTDKKILFVFTKYNSGFESDKVQTLRSTLNRNYDLVYECAKDKEVNWIYMKANTSNLQNLIPNNSFITENDNTWVTNTPKYVSTDSNNKGSAPSPEKSAKLIGSGELADLHSSLIPVQQDSTYSFKVYSDASELQSGELGILIDEYTEANQWIRAIWVGSAPLKKKAYIAGLYTPGSPSVYGIRIHTYLEKKSKGTVYLDNYLLYKIN